MIFRSLFGRSVLSIGITASFIAPRSFAYIVPNSTTTSKSSFLPPQSTALNASKTSTTTASQRNTSTDTNMTLDVDHQYPGTAVTRLQSVHTRVAQLASNPENLNGPWNTVRRKLLWAGGLRDLPDAIPGMGYTGHAFNDYNHVDLTTMNDETVYNKHDGEIKQIAIGNNLGPGIKIASIPELGPGGSWSTCSNGCDSDPPMDVAHVQFRSRIAFKLVWVPNENYDTFVLVDDDGKLLAKGKPSDGPESLPSLRQRQMNFNVVKGSKYAVAAEKLATQDHNVSEEL